MLPLSTFWPQGHQLTLSPGGPCWRRIQNWRRLLEASRAGDIIRDTSSSVPSPRAPASSCPLSSSRAGRSTSSTNQTHAPSPTADRPTSAGTVSRSTQLQSVILQAQLTLNLDSFQHYLACHPDRQWSQSLLQGICKGVDIGYQGKRKTVWSGNWKSALDNGSVVNEYLAAKVALGRKAGLFDQPPFHTYIGSPVDIVFKKHLDSVKYHIIHDLSWPLGDSVSDHIDPDLYCCVYASFNQAVSLVKKHGVGTLMAKLDLADASKHILVHPEDWLLLCSSWDVSLGDSLVLRQCYVDLFLPFGLWSSPAIFNQYMDGSQFAMHPNGIGDLLLYLDNYFMAGPTGSGECQHNITTMVKVCREMGFAVNTSKVTAPSPITCFLGIDIDTHEGVAHVDPECLKAITQELIGFKQAKLAMKQESTFTHQEATFCLQGMPPGSSIPVEDDWGLQEGTLPVPLHEAECRVLGGCWMRAHPPTSLKWGQLPVWCRLDQQPRCGAVYQC